MISAYLLRLSRLLSREVQWDYEFNGSISIFVDTLFASRTSKIWK